MYEFREIPADDPLLETSPLVRALDFLAAKFEEHPKGIPLTKSLAFKRDLVSEVIVEIQWPDWTEDRIYGGYAPVKVVDEYHFLPFCDLHGYLVNLKLVRRYKVSVRCRCFSEILWSPSLVLFALIASY